MPFHAEIRVRSDGGFLYMLNAKGKIRNLKSFQWVHGEVKREPFMLSY